MSPVPVLCQPACLQDERFDAQQYSFFGEGLVDTGLEESQLDGALEVSVRLVLRGAGAGWMVAG